MKKSSPLLYYPFMKLRLRIFRYDPSQGRSGYDTFEVECSEGMTFLSALQRIKEEDPTLSFRQFCRAGICGTCAILIDGFPRLACREQLFPYALLRGEVTLEPLGGFPKVKDLAVDHESVPERMRELGIWVEGCREEVRIAPEVNRDLERAADCILCNACQAHCPQTLERDYAGPLLFAKLYRLLRDPRDCRGEERLTLALREGHLYHCLSCDKCNSTCPQEVRPADLIRELMVYIKEDGTPER